MAVTRLRSKLVLVFLAATLLPLAAILWTSSALMSRSLAFLTTADVPQLSASLEQVAREYYRLARNTLAADAAARRVVPDRFEAAQRATWPPSVQQFWESNEPDRFVLSEPDGGELYYLVRRDDEVWRYSRRLDGVRMGAITRQLQQARAHASDLRRRDLPRGFTLALATLSAVLWVFSLALVLYFASRISTPIERLTSGLADLADGKFDSRVAAPTGRDEVGRALDAFNRTAGQLQQYRSRLVYLTQVASWQMLARKMAHELKNSLTPIRLTVEEMQARQPAGGDQAFVNQAARIVVDEVESLERRVRAFSEFAAEPATRPVVLDLNSLIEERVALLRAAHPAVEYQAVLDPRLPAVMADADRMKEIVGNLLQNAAQAAGDGGRVLVVTSVADGKVNVDVHDSGPGLSAEARAGLFEPTISFKKHGMGLGLAISRKNALVAGGDLVVVEGRLGGAGFRLQLPLGNA
jgi:nitrogen fixation/metabolism regulation signal transduction histidine kinase